MNFEQSATGGFSSLVARHTAVVATVLGEGLQNAEAVGAVGRGFHPEVLRGLDQLVVPVPADDGSCQPKITYSSVTENQKKIFLYKKKRPNY